MLHGLLNQPRADRWVGVCCVCPPETAWHSETSGFPWELLGARVLLRGELCDHLRVEHGIERPSIGELAPEIVTLDVDWGRAL